jgi:glycosyltransferase involved in cell wall biosynthesis
LAALAAQDFHAPWELIVVDDASADGSAHIVANWAQRFPSCRVIGLPTRGGPSRARNVGTRAARGAAIAYCDADHVVSRQWLRELVDLLDSYEMATGPSDLTVLNRAALHSWRREPPTGIGRHQEFLDEVSTANLAVRRDVFDRVGGFDEAMPVGHDVDFAWRVQMGGGLVGFSFDAVVHYRLPRRWRAYTRQYVDYGVAQVERYARYRTAGVPRLPMQGMARVLGMAAGVPLLVIPAFRYHWMAALGIVVGHLKGSVRFGVFYL